MLSPQMILILCVFVSTLLGTRPETNKVTVEQPNLSTTQISLINNICKSVWFAYSVYLYFISTCTLNSSSPRFLQLNMKSLLLFWVSYYIVRHVAGSPVPPYDNAGRPTATKPPGAELMARVKAPQAKEGGNRLEVKARGVDRKCVEANWYCDRHTESSYCSNTLQLLMLRSLDMSICPVLYPHPASWPYSPTPAAARHNQFVDFPINSVISHVATGSGPHKEGWAKLASSCPRRLFTKLIHQFSWLMRIWMIFFLSLEHLPPLNHYVMI